MKIIDERVKKLKEKLKENSALSVDEIQEILGSKIYLNIDEMEYILEEPKYTLRFWEDEYNLKIKRSEKKESKNTPQKENEKEKRPPRQYVAKDIFELQKIKDLRRKQNLTTQGVKNKLPKGKKVDNEREITERLQKIKQELVFQVYLHLFLFF